MEEQWSPEQISNRLAKEGKATVSYNTIYRAIKAGIMEAKGTRKNRHGRYPMSKYLHLTTRRIDVEENAEKNRENARLSVKTPTKDVEKMAYSGTHHEKTKYRNHKPRSN
ncbi:MAG: helix-turn-helix domain-containing protein [Angelakisella sp.]|nr:helix-turn-helix domain-containing protein [Angelakisella sp.]